MEDILVHALRNEKTYLNVNKIFNECCQKMGIECPNDYVTVLNKAIDFVRTERLRAVDFEPRAFSRKY